MYPILWILLFFYCIYCLTTFIKSKLVFSDAHDDSIYNNPSPTNHIYLQKDYTFQDSIYVSTYVRGGVGNPKLLTWRSKS